MISQKIISVSRKVFMLLTLLRNLHSLFIFVSKVLKKHFSTTGNCCLLYSLSGIHFLCIYSCKGERHLGPQFGNGGCFFFKFLVGYMVWIPGRSTTCFSLIILRVRKNIVNRKTYKSKCKK